MPQNQLRHIPRVAELNSSPEAVHVIPLGGLGEIGMNCMLIEHAGDLIMVDCGQMMPDEDTLGVDYIIPDMTFLEGYRSRLKAIVLTHAHEDHVGALPYVLPEFPSDLPIYASELTVNLLREKFREHQLSPRFHELKPRTPVRISDNFTVEPIAVTHSMALAIHTDAGVLIHTGDFKIDPNPPDGVAFDHYAFAKYAETEQGVLLLLSDSTNVDRRGSCPSEMEVVPGLEAIFRRAETGMIVSSFASSLHRIQNILNLAAEYDRAVVALGLNMERNIRIASQIGAIEIPCEYFDDGRKAMRLPPERRLVLCTGSQGEAMSALSRIAMGNHRDVNVEHGDTVVLSARKIPGNEDAIYRLINHLSRRGAHVVHEDQARIHVSGHAYRDDMKHMINLTNPRFFVPVHGEYRHLKMHCELAQEQDLLPDETVLLEDGLCLRVTSEKAEIVGQVPHGRVFVDGKGIGDVDEAIVRDRRYLSQDGMIVVIIGIDRESGDILSGPEIVGRGTVLGDEDDGTLERWKDVILNAHRELPLEIRTQQTELQAAIKRAMRRHLKKEARRFPIILPVVMEL